MSQRSEIKPRMRCKIKQGNVVYTGTVISVSPQVVVVSIVLNGIVVQGPVKRSEVLSAWFETSA